MNIFKKYRQERKARKFYSSLIRPGQICFDIGANHGKKSRFFLALGAKVVAFEPQSGCLDSLSQLSKENATFSFEKVALGSEKDMVKLHLATHTEVATLSEKFINYFETENLKWPDHEEVTMTTLDALIEKYQIPDFCKIDAEGFENEILKGLHVRIPLIEFEFTGGFVKETIENIHYLANLGGYEFNFMLNEFPAFISDKWLTKSEMLEEFSRLPIPKLHGNIFAKLKKTG